MERPKQEEPLSTRLLQLNNDTLSWKCMEEIDCKSEAGITDISHICTDETEKYFNETVGCIENIIISDDFFQIQNNFMEKFYNEFEDSEENRLSYTDIFQNYLETVEKYIEAELIKQMPGFDIRKFERELRLRPSELDGQVFEMLNTFWDFNLFKQMFVEYKKMKEGLTVDFSQDILVIKL